ncbi:MAG: hypothetical protein HY234_16260 [Acidobacteria bacterium]|nr:hypothetical protein [Acidobacteriota bacterium]
MTTTTNDKRRCAYRSPTGRRCRNDAHYAWNMCSKHCDFQKAYAAAAEIVSNRDRLDTAEGIHAMLVRTARALAAGKISSRDATSLFYAGQMMLLSLPHLRAEREKLFLADEEDAWRRKALADSHHDKLVCERSSEENEEEQEPEENQKAGNAGGGRK